MDNLENRREHYNLYYIFESDRQTHTMNLDTADKIRNNILKIFTENLKLSTPLNPPD